MGRHKAGEYNKAQAFEQHNSNDIIVGSITVKYHKDCWILPGRKETRNPSKARRVAEKMNELYIKYKKQYNNAQVQ